MPRKLYKLRVSDKPICLHESASESEEMHFALDDWDTLFGNTCSTVESDTGEDHKDSDVDEEDSDMQMRTAQNVNQTQLLSVVK